MVALLWPETDLERARHSLTQSLYAARRALGIDDLFLLGGDLRLNPERLTSDVLALEAALDAGELERVAALYTGAFADGFYLPGSAEFEHWCALQRGRLEDRVVAALDQLACQAEASGQLREALEWRKRAAALRPLDGSATIALMMTLAQAGDRAGALRHAQLHEALLRNQLDLDPDPAVVSLAARLRAPIAWQAEAPPGASLVGDAATPVATLTGTATLDAGQDLSAPSPLTGETQTATPQLAPEVVPLSTEFGASRRPDTAPEQTTIVRAFDEVAPARPAAGDRLMRRHLLKRRYAWFGVALVSAGLALWRLVTRTPTPAPVAPAPRLDQQVVVAPFRVVGASTPLAYLREGMVELLSTRLADDSAARSVDAGAVLAAWRAAGLAGSDGSRDAVVRLAARLGAERVIIGSVVGTTSHVVLTATAVNVPSAAVAGEATVEGPADSITTLVDRLVGRLLLLDAGEDGALSSQMTGSLRALRAFLDGQAAFRRGSYATALRHYEAALHADPRFALAALQLARTADRVNTVEPLTRAIAIAWRGREALDERAGALLGALAGPRYPALSTAEEQIAAWDRLIDLTPERAESWYELGAHLLRLGTSRRDVDDRSRAVAALQRAVELEPMHAPARELLVQLDAAGTGADLARPGASLGTDSTLPLAPFLRWRLAIARADSATRRDVRATLPEIGPRNLRAMALAAQVDAVALDDARSALAQLRMRSSRAADQFDAALAEHALALNEGRLHDALAITERLADLQPGARAHWRLRVLDVLYGGVDSALGATALRALHRAVEARTAVNPTERAVQLADACVLAQWRLAHGDTTGVRRISTWLRNASPRLISAAPPVAASPLACAELIDAALTVLTYPREAGGATARLDSLAWTAAVSGDAVAYGPILIARLHARAGNVAAALDAVRRRDDRAGWPRYLATALREEGQYATRVGIIDQARHAYARYLQLRADPDADLRAEVAEIRRALASEPSTVHP